MPREVDLSLLGTNTLAPSEFVTAYLAACRKVGTRDGWVGVEHLARQLGVDPGGLVAWCYANAPSVNLEIQGVAYASAMVRIRADTSEVRDLAAFAGLVVLVLGVLGLLAVVVG